MTQISPFIPHLLKTFENRFYVFIFLFFFLIFGSFQWGKLRTLGFLAIGWTIAFLSEVSSIRNGFPYGDYRYLYENLSGELLWLGVPLWDSLSYTFLAYASYSTALFLLFKPSSEQSQTKHFLLLRGSIKTILLTAILMTGLDIVIDPLTRLGDRWFLGKIYEYPNAGHYFGVPIQNFIGWALVAASIALCFQILDLWLEKKGYAVASKKSEDLAIRLGLLLYIGVFIFNFAITLWIQEFKIAIADLLLFGLFAAFWYRAEQNRKQSV